MRTYHRRAGDDDVVKALLSGKYTVFYIYPFTMEDMAFSKLIPINCEYIDIVFNSDDYPYCRSFFKQPVPDVRRWDNTFTVPLAIPHHYNSIVPHGLPYGTFTVTPELVVLYYCGIELGYVSFVVYGENEVNGAYIQDNTVVHITGIGLGEVLIEIVRKYYPRQTLPCVSAWVPIEPYKDQYNRFKQQFFPNSDIPNCEDVQLTPPLCKYIANSYSGKLMNALGYSIKHIRYQHGDVILSFH